MRKKVCIVASFALSIINFRKELIMEMSKTCDVYVCVPINTRDLKEQIERLGVVLFDIQMSSENMNPVTNIQYMLTLFKFFRKIKPDVVLSYTIKPVIWASFAAKLARVNYIASMVTGLGYSFADIQSFKRKSLNKIVCMLYKGALFFNQIVLFQNADDQSLFQQKNILGTTPSIVIDGSGVNLDYYYHCSHFPEKVTFLMMARLLKDKGIYEYVAAAKQIKSIYNNVDFHLVGWIDNNPASVTSAQLDIWCDEGVIKFLGRFDDVRSCLEACSVFVLPSYREGTPRSVLEAMSMGRAVITTDAPGCKETVVSGHNGFLVPVKNVEKLVDSMKQFIENAYFITNFGKNSREIAESRYDVHKVNNVIMSALKL